MDRGGGPPGLPPSALPRTHLVARHLLGVADVQLPVGDHRVAPRLALERREPAEFFVPPWVGLEQYDLAGFRHDHQERLLRQEHHLPAAVAALLPGALAR